MKSEYGASVKACNSFASVLAAVTDLVLGVQFLLFALFSFH